MSRCVEASPRRVRPGRPAIGARVSVAMPPDLLVLLDRYARHLGISRAGAVRLLLWQRLGRDG